MALHLPSVGFLALLLAAASAVPMPYPLPVNFSFGQCGDLVYPGCTTSVSMVRSLSLQASLCPLLVALPGLPQYVRVCFVSPTLNPVLHAHPHTPILHSRPLIIRSPPPSPFALLSCFSIPTHAHPRPPLPPGPHRPCGRRPVSRLHQAVRTKHALPGHTRTVRRPPQRWRCPSGRFGRDSGGSRGGGGCGGCGHQSCCHRCLFSHSLLDVVEAQQHQL